MGHSFLVADLTSAISRTSRPKYLGLDIRAASQDPDDCTDPHLTRKSLSPRGFHNVLELEQRIVSCLGILGIHLRVQIIRHWRAPNQACHAIVDVHHFACRHRCNRLTKPCVDGLEVALREHTLSSTPSMALTCAWAASLRAAPSIA